MSSLPLSTQNLGALLAGLQVVSTDASAQAGSSAGQEKAGFSSLLDIVGKEDASSKNLAINTAITDKKTLPAAPSGIYTKTENDNQPQYITKKLVADKADNNNNNQPQRDSKTTNAPATNQNAEKTSAKASAENTNVASEHDSAELEDNNSKKPPATLLNVADLLAVILQFIEE